MTRLLFILPAGSYNEMEMAQYLLSECHTDLNSATRDGSRPLSLTRQIAIIRLFLQHGAVATDVDSLLYTGSPREAFQSTACVFVVWDRARKGTLAMALTTESEGIAQLAQQLNKVSGVKGNYQH